MNPLWQNLYDRVKDRCYGLLFLFAASGVFVLWLLAGAGAELNSEFPAQVKETVTIIGALAVVGVVLRVGREFFRPGRRAWRGENCSRLSSDELSKARSKLIRKQDGKAL